MVHEHDKRDEQTYGRWDLVTKLLFLVLQSVEYLQDR